MASGAKQVRVMSWESEQQPDNPQDPHSSYYEQLRIINDGSNANDGKDSSFLVRLGSTVELRPTSEDYVVGEVKYMCEKKGIKYVAVRCFYTRDFMLSEEKKKKKYFQLESGFEENELLTGGEVIRFLASSITQPCFVIFISKGQKPPKPVSATQGKRQWKVFFCRYRYAQSDSTVSHVSPKDLLNEGLRNTIGTGDTAEQPPESLRKLLGVDLRQLLPNPAAATAKITVHGVKASTTKPSAGVSKGSITTSGARSGNSNSRSSGGNNNMSNLALKKTVSQQAGQKRSRPEKKVRTSIKSKPQQPGRAQKRTRPRGEDSGSDSRPRGEDSGSDSTYGSSSGCDSNDSSGSSSSDSGDSSSETETESEDSISLFPSSIDTDTVTNLSVYELAQRIMCQDVSILRKWAKSRPVRDAKKKKDTSRKGNQASYGSLQKGLLEQDDLDRIWCDLPTSRRTAFIKQAKELKQENRDASIKNPNPEKEKNNNKKKNDEQQTATDRTSSSSASMKMGPVRAASAGGISASMGNSSSIAGKAPKEPKASKIEEVHTTGKAGSKPPNSSGSNRSNTTSTNAVKAVARANGFGYSSAEMTGTAMAHSASASGSSTIAACDDEVIAFQQTSAASTVLHVLSPEQQQQRQPSGPASGQASDKASDKASGLAPRTQVERDLDVVPKLGGVSDADLAVHIMCADKGIRIANIPDDNDHYNSAHSDKQQQGRGASAGVASGLRLVSRSRAGELWKELEPRARASYMRRLRAVTQHIQKESAASKDSSSSSSAATATAAGGEGVTGVKAKAAVVSTILQSHEQAQAKAKEQLQNTCTAFVNHILATTDSMSDVYTALMIARSVIDGGSDDGTCTALLKEYGPSPHPPFSSSDIAQNRAATSNSTTIVFPGLRDARIREQWLLVPEQERDALVLEAETLLVTKAKQLQQAAFILSSAEEIMSAAESTFAAHSSTGTTATTTGTVPGSSAAVVDAGGDALTYNRAEGCERDSVAASSVNYDGIIAGIEAGLGEGELAFQLMCMDFSLPTSTSNPSAGAGATGGERGDVAPPSQSSGIINQQELKEQHEQGANLSIRNLRSKWLRLSARSRGIYTRQARQLKTEYERTGTIVGSFPGIAGAGSGDFSAQEAVTDIAKLPQTSSNRGFDGDDRVQSAKDDDGADYDDGEDDNASLYFDEHPPRSGWSMQRAKGSGLRNLRSSSSRSIPSQLMDASSLMMQLWTEASKSRKESYLQKVKQLRKVLQQSSSSSNSSSSNSSREASTSLSTVISSGAVDQNALDAIRNGIPDADVAPILLKFDHDLAEARARMLRKDQVDEEEEEQDEWASSDGLDASTRRSGGAGSAGGSSVTGMRGASKKRKAVLQPDWDDPPTSRGKDAVGVAGKQLEHKHLATKASAGRDRSLGVGGQHNDQAQRGGAGKRGRHKGNRGSDSDPRASDEEEEVEEGAINNSTSFEGDGLRRSRRSAGAGLAKTRRSDIGDKNIKGSKVRGRLEDQAVVRRDGGRGSSRGRDRDRVRDEDGDEDGVELDPADFSAGLSPRDLQRAKRRQIEFEKVAQDGERKRFLRGATAKAAAAAAADSREQQPALPEIRVGEAFQVPIPVFPPVDFLETTKTTTSISSSSSSADGGDAGSVEAIRERRRGEEGAVWVPGAQASKAASTTTNATTATTASNTAAATNKDISSAEIEEFMALAFDELLALRLPALQEYYADLTALAASAVAAADNRARDVLDTNCFLMLPNHLEDKLLELLHSCGNDLGEARLRLRDTLKPLITVWSSQEMRRLSRAFRKYGFYRKALRAAAPLKSFSQVGDYALRFLDAAEELEASLPVHSFLPANVNLETTKFDDGHRSSSSAELLAAAQLFLQRCACSVDPVSMALLAMTFALFTGTSAESTAAQLIVRVRSILYACKFKPQTRPQPQSVTQPQEEQQNEKQPTQQRMEEDYMDPGGKDTHAVEQSKRGGAGGASDGGVGVGESRGDSSEKGVLRASGEAPSLLPTISRNSSLYWDAESDEVGVTGTNVRGVPSASNAADGDDRAGAQSAPGTVESRGGAAARAMDAAAGGAATTGAGSTGAAGAAGAGGASDGTHAAAAAVVAFRSRAEAMTHFARFLPTLISSRVAPSAAADRRSSSNSRSSSSSTSSHSNDSDAEGSSEGAGGGGDDDEVDDDEDDDEDDDDDDDDDDDEDDDDEQGDECSGVIGNSASAAPLIPVE